MSDWGMQKEVDSSWAHLHMDTYWIPVHTPTILTCGLSVLSPLGTSELPWGNWTGGGVTVAKGN